MRFSCTKHLNLLVVLGWVGLDPIFSTYSGLGWVRQSMDWVGSGHTKWTHGQLRAYTELRVRYTLPPVVTVAVVDADQRLCAECKSLPDYHPARFEDTYPTYSVFLFVRL